MKKWWTQVSSTVTIRDRKFFPSASKRANNSEEVDLHDCGARRNTSRTHRWTSKTQNDVPNTSFADWKTERHLSSCYASILTNDGITLQHFRTNICDRTAWASCDVPVSEAATLFARRPTVLQSTATLHKRCYWWMFITDSFSATSYSVTECCLYHTSWPTP